MYRLFPIECFWAITIDPIDELCRWKGPSISARFYLIVGFLRACGKKCMSYVKKRTICHRFSNDVQLPLGTQYLISTIKVHYKWVAIRTKHKIKVQWYSCRPHKILFLSDFSWSYLCMEEENGRFVGRRTDGRPRQMAFVSKPRRNSEKQTENDWFCLKMWKAILSVDDYSKKQKTQDGLLVNPWRMLCQKQSVDWIAK